MTAVIFAETRAVSEEKRLLRKAGTIVDATFIAAPSFPGDHRHDHADADRRGVPPAEGRRPTLGQTTFGTWILYGVLTPPFRRVGLTRRGE